MPNFHRNPAEGEVEYIFRICENKDLIGSWDEVAKLLNKELNYEYTESKYRKDYNSFKKLFEANRAKLVDGEERLESIRVASNELKKERIRLQTEKLEYNAWLRENARDELIVEKLIGAIENLEPLPVPDVAYDKRNGEKEYVLCFGDEHLGCEFEIKGLMGEVINAYSPEIFAERMAKLLDYTKHFCREHDIGTLHVFSMGDFTDGVLRVGQLMKLRWGVVDSTVKYMEFISEWLNELTSVVNVRFHMVAGNHSELRMFNQPRGAFKDENMNKVVVSYIKARMKYNQNFELIKNPSGNIFDSIAGYNILGVHGEMKDMEKAIKDLTNTYGVEIHYLLGGHLHHSASETTGVKKGVIRVPSVVGIDDFAMTLNKCSNPAAVIVEFTPNHGKTAEYFIDLT